ncbi:UNVERIFIED_ORG: filamentous hemagglutinin family protein [Paraburkholderia sediminicola]|uniref:two-partner secretion domain-containing protein n=1 Tax=Paraburkholderia TaxID=1822464 RepID=UPI00211158D2|nr:MULTISPECIES: filamentous hemagglutinin N-terminal domain-containing protein [Paraburkholderia]MCP2087405.1 filamentous hemagglutinin family protein [Paraburkholderia sediminicola]MCX4143234.1 filamentous hemagglutinin N-terminal domain-containing protein [Paraburkholderia aspalathi]MDN7175907.1 filamentous hemagglutinin N-terminal domain-containing protein [Paraburkholderia sp. SEWSISQ10-3 4]MDQ6505548.1 filamentous hemagglutinin N-terminal domain-containing protein [Paraburkholderia aspala
MKTGMLSSARGSSAGHGSPRLRYFQFRLIVVAPIAVQGSASAIGISVDGGTATTISSAANSHQTVNIASIVAGVSSDTYSSFNVNAAVVSLNSVGINAQAILNRATGTHPSIIGGPIGVIGPRADVILADPSGIAMNDASFAGIRARTCSQFDVQNCCVDSGAITRST